ncbi:MAG: fructose-6-phosphate aldolase [Deltaproteobacteria bacterium]|nr:fructose-6-phosphate aldolase [Deltaproteobacteria bacterium]
MQLFLDTADAASIRRAAEMGVLDGVTTNPTLVAKAGRSISDVIVEICEIVKGPVSVESVAETAEGMVGDARKFSKLSKHVVVKFPFCEEGLKATKIVSKEGIRVNMTLIFSPLQAWLAAKAGAAYVSPFIGRLDDIATPGMQLIEQIVRLFDRHRFSTKVLAASIRHPIHVLEAALLGAHVATMPPEVFHKMFPHPLTKSGIEQFNKDYRAIPPSPSL